MYEHLLCVRRALKPKGRYLFGWPDDRNTAKGAAGRWRQVLQKKEITTYDSCELPFQDYSVAEQTEIAHSAGFTITALYNRYDPDERYDESRPGLIVVARKDTAIQGG